MAPSFLRGYGLKFGGPRGIHGILWWRRNGTETVPWFHPRGERRWCVATQLVVFHEGLFEFCVALELVTLDSFPETCGTGVVLYRGVSLTNL